MKCPACHAPLSEPAPQCPQCGLTLRKLDAHFGIAPRHHGHITDYVGKFSRPETEKLRARLRLFETKFPQSKFSVVLTRIANGAPISEYSFWLANRGNFTATDATGGDNFNLLLVIDVESAEAALVIGYGLEQYLSEKDLSDALERARSRWTKGDFSRGIRACVDHLMVRMRSVAWEIEKSTAPPASPIATEPAQSESEKSQ